jgi:predicted acylesterase/phospholipase RssA
MNSNSIANIFRFVVAVGSEANTAVRFTNYSKQHEQSDFLEDVTIWEAARATSAAPSFFDPIKINYGGITETFIDGALGQNNPVEELWMESQEVFGKPLEAQIRVILSLGTGRPTLDKVGSSMKAFGKTLIAISVETQKTAVNYADSLIKLNLKLCTLLYI